MAEEEGAYTLLTNCPSSILSSEQGLDLMQESGEPMVDARVGRAYGVRDF